MTPGKGKRGDSDGDKGDKTNKPEKTADLDKAFQEALSKKQMFEVLRGYTAGSGDKKAGRSYSVGDLLGARATAVFKAKGIAQDSGDPATVGRLLIALERFMEAAGAHVRLTRLEFGHSVELEFAPQISSNEERRLKEALKEQETREAAPDHDAATAEEIEAEALHTSLEFSRLVPSSVAALEGVARLLDQRPEKVAGRVNVLGVTARQELQKLAATLEQNGASLVFVSPAATEGKLTKAHAARYATTLKKSNELKPIEIVITGRLTRTDSDSEAFRVVLDPKLRPVELHARRMHVEGGYTAEASEQVRDGGLWDTMVIARVRVTLARPPGGGKPKPARFLFLSVTAAA